MSDEQQQQPSFQIEKLYVKDLSLEIPNAPQVFVQQAQPQLEVQINTEGGQFAEGYFEVTVSATVTAKAGERTMFLAEAVQAAGGHERARSEGAVVRHACGQEWMRQLHQDGTRPSEQDQAFRVDPA